MRIAKFWCQSKPCVTFTTSGKVTRPLTCGPNRNPTRFSPPWAGERNKYYRKEILLFLPAFLEGSLLLISFPSPPSSASANPSRHAQGAEAPPSPLAYSPDRTAGFFIASCFSSFLIRFSFAEDARSVRAAWFLPDADALGVCFRSIGCTKGSILVYSLCELSRYSNLLFPDPDFVRRCVLGKCFEFGKFDF